MTRLVLRNLLPGQQYAIQVRAVSDDTFSEWSPRFVFTTDTYSTIPDTPTGFSWVAVADAFHGEWNPVSSNVAGSSVYVERYELELTAGSAVRVVSAGANPTTVSFDLPFETNIALFGTAQPVISARVRAIDRYGNASAWTNSIIATNPPPGSPLPATDGSPVAVGSDATITLSWSAPADQDLTGYAVYVGATAGFTPANNNRIYSGTSTRFDYTTSNYSTQFFKIFAVDKFGQQSTTPLTGNAQATSPFNVDTTPPSAPTSLSVAISTNDVIPSASAIATWTKNPVESDLAGYILEYRVSGASQWSSVDLPPDTLNSSISNLVAYANYDFRIRAYDFTSNYSAATTATATGGTNAAPSQPAAPSAAANTMQIQVTVSGGRASNGSPMETDVTFYEVYASTNSAFTPDSTTMLGVIPVGPAMVGTFDVPASSGTGGTQNWWVKIIAVDRGGLKSPSSVASSSVSVPLISNVNIADATITKAKITSLNADTIEAGNGFINDITVKSTFTLGDGTSNGTIQSYNYVNSGGASGFQLTNNSLVIKNGSIEAAALKLQVGENLMPSYYADFESASAVNKFTTAQGAMSVSLSSVSKRFNNQSLAVSWVTAQSVDPILYLGSSVTDYNIPVVGGIPYIFSAYFWCPTNVPTNIVWSVKWSNGTIQQIASAGLNASGTSATAQRLSGALTAPAGVTGGVLLVDSSTLTQFGGWNMDGVQVERQYGNTTIPSQWRPPGNTIIDGGLIRTGSIQSSQTITVNGNAIPLWSINTSGSAVFANANIRGATVLGNITNGSNTDADASTISSANYIQGSIGWQIRSDGTADLRYIGADAISMDSVSSSNLTKPISLLSSLVATGEMGETVTLGTSGFTVVGPKEMSIVNRSLTTNTATITTSAAHNFTNGAKIVISGLGAPFDGTKYITSIPSATTLTFVEPYPSNIASLAVTGLVKGKDSTGISGPTYIDFPTDGSSPNIISGTTTADTLIVTTGATFRGTSGIENGATFTIASNVIAPTINPSVDIDYNTRTLTPTPSSTYNIRDSIIGHNGNLFILYDVANGNYWNIGIMEYSTDTNALIADRVIYDGSSSGVVWYNALSFTYGASAAGGAGSYYVNYNYYKSDLSMSQNIDRVSPSWVAARVPLSTAPTPVKPKLGWDYNAGAPVSVSLDDPNGRLVFTPITINSTTGNITGMGTNYYSSTSGSNATLGLGFVGVGNFDGFAGALANRIVWRYKTPVTSGPTRNFYNYWQIRTTGGSTTNVSEGWPVADASQPIIGAYFNIFTNKFGEAFLTPGGDIQYREYYGGDSYWTESSTPSPQARTVGYTWYDSNVGGNGQHETTLSPTYTALLPKRARMKVTVSSIPKTSNLDSPDSAKVYVSSTVGGTTTWRAGPTIVYPYRSDYISTSVTTVSLPVSNTFVTGANPATTIPGQILSTSGRSFWKGDDTAQFYQMRLVSNFDVSTTPLNIPDLGLSGTASPPPLIIGDPSGRLAAGNSTQHMRIDANEIQVMNSNTNGDTATLFLQQGGGNLNLDGASNTRVAGKWLRAWGWNNETVSVNASGEANVTHGLSGVPDFVIVTIGNNGSVNNRISVTSRDATGDGTKFKVEVRNSSTNATAASGTTVNINWFAARS